MVTENLKNFWIAEYGAQQDCFNVDTLSRALAVDRSMVAWQRNNDYLMFGLFNNDEEAHAACDEMKAMQQREKEVTLCQNPIG